MSEKDYTAQYKKRMKTYRPWAFFLLFWLIAFFTSLAVVAVSEASRSYLTLVMLISLIIAIPAFTKTYAAMKCPACKRFMGRDIGYFCPLCGVRIREEKNK